MIFYAERNTGFLIAASFYGAFSIDVDILICRKKMCNINKEAKERQEFQLDPLIMKHNYSPAVFLPGKKMN